MKKNIKHGLFVGNNKKYTKLYTAWISMRSGITNPKSNKYPYSGAIGIKVCPEWETYTGFITDMQASFDAHVALYGANKTCFVRIDMSKDFYKDNCHWVRPSEIKRKESRQFEHDGKLYTAKELKAILNVDIYKVFREGCTLEDYLERRFEGKMIDPKRMDLYYKYQDLPKSVKSTLPYRLLEVMECMYGGDGPKTLGYVGDKFGVCRERIRQLRRKSFDLMSIRAI